MIEYRVPPMEARRRLEEGNKRFIDAEFGQGSVHPEIRRRTAKIGQKPYAIIICCSDSRVIPEQIFSADIGDLFVIRVAGNVIDNHQLGSIEYAEEHLGVGLVLVLGHTHCGAVEAAIHHNPEGYVKFITDEITTAIGREKNSLRASWLNVQHSCALIEESLIIQQDEKESGLQVKGAMYDIETGKVTFDV